MRCGVKTMALRFFSLFLSWLPPIRDLAWPLPCSVGKRFAESAIFGSTSDLLIFRSLAPAYPIFKTSSYDCFPATCIDLRKERPTRLLRVSWLMVWKVTLFPHFSPPCESLRYTVSLRLSRLPSMMVTRCKNFFPPLFRDENSDVVLPPPTEHERALPRVTDSRRPLPFYDVRTTLCVRVPHCVVRRQPFF